MSSLNTIRERLALRLPDVGTVIDNDVIWTRSPDPHGFDVCLYEGNGEWIVGYEGWHEHFKSIDEALNCFAYAFSSECRLKVTLRGGTPHAWTLESFDAGNWRGVSTTGKLFFPWWRRRRIEYRQNGPRTSG